MTFFLSPRPRCFWAIARFLSSCVVIRTTLMLCDLTRLLKIYVHHVEDAVIKKVFPESTRAGGVGLTAAFFFYVISFSAAIRACEKGRPWQQAREMLSELKHLYSALARRASSGSRLGRCCRI